MSKMVLVTGGAGFIGVHVSSYLLESGHSVVILDDLSGGLRENVPKQAVFIQGSITDETLVKQLFKKYQFTYVYHLAAYAAEGLSPYIRKFNYENNLIGSINLINASVNYEVSCFVFTSSIAVYGSLPSPYSEAQHPLPKDPYGIAKLAVEQDLKNAYAQFGLNYIIFRPHNVYGPLQNINDPYRNVIGIFMNQILKDQPLTIFGDGTQTRAFSYIDDVAPYIAKATAYAKMYNQTFNIGADKSYTVKALAGAVQKAMSSDMAITYLKERLEVAHATADHSLFKKVFNPKPTVSLDSGLSQMARWVKTQDCQKSKRFDKIEITKNLPETWNLKPGT